jgi:outer membrane receptor protein involved in Fe transport
MTTRAWRRSALLLSISALAFAAQAQAAETIETVVVTASKRAETLKNVPLSVTVLGQDELTRLNARSFEDYVNNIPGMGLLESSPTHPQIVLRGINAGGVGSTVGILLDESPYGSSSALANGTDTAPNLDTFDMQRVEVLRGPQGTLYGASTLGGLLKFVTNAPDPTAMAAQFEAGGTTLDDGGSGGFARAMVNVPLADDFAVRVVGFDKTDPGWIDDPLRKLKDINGVRSFGGRAAALYEPTSKVSVRLNALTQEVHANNDASEDVTLVGGNLVPTYGLYEQQRTVNSYSATRYSLYNATVNWNLDWASLTSATSYGTLHDFLFTDASGVYGADVQGFLRVDKFTQEVRLASNPGSGPLDWLAGVYYTHEDASLHQDIVFAPHGTPLGSLQLDSSYIETAGFADATYHFSPSFDISVGGRYSHNSQDALEFGLASAAGASTGDVFTWSTSADYHVDEDTTLYARIAKGFRPGGPNPLPIGGGTGAPAFFGADSLISYEGGVKSDLLDGKLSFDADVYYIDWTDIQLLAVINNTGVDVNGGSARSYGVEWDAQWRPLDRLTLGWSGAYTNAALTSDTPPIVGGLDGDPLPWAPKWTSTLDGDYRFAPMGDWAPYIGGSWRYIGSRASDFQFMASQVTLPSYDTFDARLGVDWHDWEIELYGKNLSDAKGFTEYTATGTSAASGLSGTAAVIAPRMFGIVLRGKF